MCFVTLNAAFAEQEVLFHQFAIPASDGVDKWVLDLGKEWALKVPHEGIFAIAGDMVCFAGSSGYNWADSIGGAGGLFIAKLGDYAKDAGCKYIYRIHTDAKKHYSDDKRKLLKVTYESAEAQFCYEHALLCERIDFKEFPSEITQDIRSLTISPDKKYAVFSTTYEKLGMLGVVDLHKKRLIQVFPIEARIKEQTGLEFSEEDVSMHFLPDCPTKVTYALFSQYSEEQAKTAKRVNHFAIFDILNGEVEIVKLNIGKEDDLWQLYSIQQIPGSNDFILNRQNGLFFYSEKEGLKKLDEGFAHVYASKLSPDGKRIAFSGRKSGVGYGTRDLSIYVMDIESKNVTLVQKEEYIDSSIGMGDSNTNDNKISVNEVMTPYFWSKTGDKLYFYSNSGYISADFSFTAIISDWSALGGDKYHTRYRDDIDVLAEGFGEDEAENDALFGLVKQFETGDKIRSSLLIDDGKIYFSGNNNVYSIDLTAEEDALQPIASYRSTTYPGFDLTSSFASAGDDEETLVIGGKNLTVLSKTTGIAATIPHTDDIVTVPLMGNVKEILESGDATPRSLNGTMYAQNPSNSQQASDAGSAGKKKDNSSLIAFYGTTGGEFICYDITKKSELWSYQADGAIVSSPVISNENQRVYFGDTTGMIYSVNINLSTMEQQGSRYVLGTSDVQEFDTQDSEGIYASPSIMADSKKVVFVTRSGIVYACDLDNIASNTRGALGLSGFDVTSSPAIKGNSIYVGSNHGLHRFDLSDEKLSLKWSKDYGGVVSSPVICAHAGTRDDTYLFISLRETGQVCLIKDKPDGPQKVWKRTLEGGIVSTPAVTDNMVIVADMAGCVYVFGTQINSEEDDDLKGVSVRVYQDIKFLPEDESPFEWYETPEGRYAFFMQSKTPVFIPSISDQVVYKKKTRVKGIENLVFEAAGKKVVTVQDDTGSGGVEWNLSEIRDGQKFREFELQDNGLLCVIDKLQREGIYRLELVNHLSDELAKEYEKTVTREFYVLYPELPENNIVAFVLDRTPPEASTESIFKFNDKTMLTGDLTNYSWKLEPRKSYYVDFVDPKSFANDSDHTGDYRDFEGVMPGSLQYSFYVKDPEGNTILGNPNPSGITGNTSDLVFKSEARLVPRGTPPFYKDGEYEVGIACSYQEIWFEKQDKEEINTADGKKKGILAFRDRSQSDFINVPEVDSKTDLFASPEILPGDTSFGVPDGGFQVKAGYSPFTFTVLDQTAPWLVSGVRRDDDVLDYLADTEAEWRKVMDTGAAMGNNPLIVYKNPEMPFITPIFLPTVNDDNPDTLIYGRMVHELNKGGDDYEIGISNPVSIKDISPNSELPLEFSLSLGDEIGNYRYALVLWDSQTEWNRKTENEKMLLGNQEYAKQHYRGYCGNVEVRELVPPEVVVRVLSADNASGMEIAGNTERGPFSGQCTDESVLLNEDEAYTFEVAMTDDTLYVRDRFGQSQDARGRWNLECTLPETANCIRKQEDPLKKGDKELVTRFTILFRNPTEEETVTILAEDWSGNTSEVEVPLQVRPIYFDAQRGFSREHVSQDTDGKTDSVDTLIDKLEQNVGD